MKFLAYDLFDFWRWFLAIACTIYTFIVTARWAWEWLKYLAADDRQTLLIRHYLVVQLLRVRLRRFWGELLQIGALCAALALLVMVHFRVFAQG